MANRTPAPIRVMCVDDNRLVIDALEQRLRYEQTLEWAGWVSDGAEILDRVLAARPDVVLMDIDMPGTDVFGLVERLSAELPGTRIVMFSGHVTIPYIERAMDCGAWGYLSKSDDTAEIIEGIRQAARGEIALSREVEAVQQRGRAERGDQARSKAG